MSLSIGDELVTVQQPDGTIACPALLWAFGHAAPDATRALLLAAMLAMRQSPSL